MTLRSVRHPSGSGGPRLSAALNETALTVVAERVARADTFATRLVGLLGRSGLGQDEGLWISPCRGIHTMGMRFPIDALFLDDRQTVVGLREEMPPWRSSGFVKGALSVLELPAGAIRRTGVAMGDRIDFVPSGVTGGLEEEH